MLTASPLFALSLCRPHLSKDLAQVRIDDTLIVGLDLTTTTIPTCHLVSVFLPLVTVFTTHTARLVPTFNVRRT